MTEKRQKFGEGLVFTRVASISPLFVIDLVISDNQRSCRGSFIIFCLHSLLSFKFCLFFCVFQFFYFIEIGSKCSSERNLSRFCFINRKNNYYDQCAKCKIIYYRPTKSCRLILRFILNFMLKNNPLY